MNFQPDYHYMLDVLSNRRPARREFFTQFCRFFKEMTYDTVSYEVCITEILPDSGAIVGGKPGPIQNRDDFEKYPWDELPDRYWNVANLKFDMLALCLPEGMKALGGVGNGVFEISEDLVGFEYLAYMMMGDPELYAALYQKIGDLMAAIWSQFLRRYSDTFAICRFGDDLGFKTGTLISPEMIRQHIIPLGIQNYNK